MLQKRNIHLNMCEYLSIEDAQFYLRAKRKIKGTDKLQSKVKFKKRELKSIQ